MSENNLSDWQQAAADLNLPTQAFVNGSYSPALSGNTAPIYNPATGALLAEVTDCGPDDADQAVKIAREAFESGIWSNRAPAQRKKVLLRWADLMQQHADELALMETLNVGKPISDSTNVDIPGAINCFRWTRAGFGQNEGGINGKDTFGGQAADVSNVRQRLGLRGMGRGLIPSNQQITCPQRIDDFGYRPAKRQDARGFFGH